MPVILRERVGDGVELLTLNRPETRNAITFEVVDLLLEMLDDIEHDLEIRSIVLTGSGRGFCSGMDLNLAQFEDGAPEVGSAYAVTMRQKRGLSRIVARFHSIPQGVVTAVNGPAFGIGMVLGLCGDIRIASPDAKFRVGFINMGLSACEMGLSWLLPNLIGLSKATELMLTGRDVLGEQAAEIGLVNEVVPPEDLLARAIAVAEEIATNTPMGVWMTRDILWRGANAPFEQVLELENRTQVLLLGTNDQQEQVMARVEGRPPRYTFD